MKKYVARVIVAVVCVVVVVGGYYIYSRQKRTSVEDTVNLTEAQMIITKNLEKDYPLTPREVVKLYNRISLCYYNEDYTDDELKELCSQMRLLFDDELAEQNPENEYYESVKADVEQYHELSKTISSATVCDTNDVKYQTIDGDECAYVTCSYFVNENKKYSRTYETFVLRKDAEGEWKILVFYLTEGDSSDD
jgi:hypothetical protein